MRRGAAAAGYRRRYWWWGWRCARASVRRSELASPQRVLLCVLFAPADGPPRARGARRQATVLVSWRITMVARRALAAAIGGQEAAAAVGGAGDGGSVQLLAQQQRTKGV